MKVAAALLALLWAAAGRAESPQPGDVYAIRTTYQTSTIESDGSSSSSQGGQVTSERVVAVRDDGLELEYDLPPDSTAADRARTWQLPARILVPETGPIRLLNAPELEARLEAWLKAAGWTRESCGRWIFTWNAFLIDCDPHSVLEQIEAVNLRSAEPRDGAVYRDPGSGVSATLVRTADRIFAATVDVDPEAVRRARAESDVVVGKIMGKEVALEAALAERAKERVGGTIAVTLEADAAGDVRRLTRVTRIDTVRPDGVKETETRVETIERQLISSGPR